MKKIIILFAFIGFLLMSCELDNFEEPNVTITGKVVYDGRPIGVRSNGVQLELWQEGHQLYTKVPIFIAHDGTFSAVVFGGDYKMVRLSGAPWENQSTDTILVNARNNISIDVPVIPYYIIDNESIRASSGTITASFTVTQVSTTAGLAEVRLYLGKSILTDQNRNEYAINLDTSTLSLGQQATMTATIPANLVQYPYIYARIGVRSTATNEFIYTQVQQVNLN
ncbi:MAG: DUF3823 domain-containing protein [Capnocytophaga sp.]|nr:DUF3823 domain-containing protein [Capnocytophaga sp.]